MGQTFVARAQLRESGPWGQFQNQSGMGMGTEEWESGTIFSSTIHPEWNGNETENRERERDQENAIPTVCPFTACSLPVLIFFELSFFGRIN